MDYWQRLVVEWDWLATLSVVALLYLAWSSESVRVWRQKRRS